MTAAPRTLLPGLAARDVEVDGVRLRVAVGGDGPPVLLLHGHPQTHATWRDVVPALARRHTVVAPDLRGYGDSDVPPSDREHRPYSKRVMAAEAVALMRHLGHERFAVVGHDRGGRVAHRMVLDHPDAVTRLAVLDIAPTLTMYERTDQDFATRYFWWFFLIQPAPLPETLIAGAREAFLAEHLARQSATPGVPDQELAAEYRRCYRDANVHAICEDYRAAATVDLAHDRADRDAGRRLGRPLLALWGSRGTVGRTYDVLQTWREVSDAAVDGAALECGHVPQEERPAEVAERLEGFLSG
ncbi:alpha/beta fold hydrolase [Georgenia alba]|uniref:Alpha/beta fold hydrolase n=1 Tax=Georgenia alba TaxID=2233858 RepID=A0ABW2Q8Z7_9MICO